MNIWCNSLLGFTLPHLSVKFGLQRGRQAGRSGLLDLTIPQRVWSFPAKLHSIGKNILCLRCAKQVKIRKETQPSSSPHLRHNGT